ncbi:MAG: hypothetical protein EPN34_01135 [Burkholderiaceae bacterium]|nr:MAG: hypothetical protein EPN34_01135 [Burkholderiaceae bacterium]
MNIVQTLIVLTAVTAAVTPCAAGAAETCRVNVRISHGDRVVTDQDLLPQPGAPAHLKMDDVDGLDLALEVERLPQGWVRGRATATAPGRSSVTAVTFRPGQPATMALDNLRLTLTVDQGGC